jgi:hypothetical protein
MKCYKKRYLSLAIGLTLYGLSTNVALADDTEIYLNPAVIDAADPLVMLTFDWRPNLGSSTCGDYRDASCADAVGPVIYPNLVKNIEEFGLAYRDADLDGNMDQFGVEPFDLVRAAIRTVISDPLVSNLRLGLALSHNYDNNCNGPGQIKCSNGAYILQGFTSLNDSDFDALGNLSYASDRYALLEKLGRIPAPSGNVSHPYQLREIYYEVFNYLTGGKIYNGHNGYTDFASTDNTENLDSVVNTYRASTSGPAIPDTTAFQWDDSPEVEAGDYYVSPYSDGEDWSCSKTFIINTYFEDNQQSNSDTHMQRSLKGLNSSFRLQGGDSAKNEAVFALLNNTDIADGQIITSHDGSTYSTPSVAGLQTVQSYFITAKNTTNAADAYAFQGGTGRALRLDDPSGLVDDLKNIFEEVLSVSTTFVAASVPVNVFNRSEIVDNIYFALFKAEAEPLWHGNLKKLKIATKVGTDGDEYLDIVSAEGGGTNSAIAGDGRIRHDAVTYWTNTQGYDVQNTSEDEEVVGADGRSITRGGAGQQIPGFLSPSNASAQGYPGYKNSEGGRQLFTETISGFSNLASTPTSESDLMPLDYDAADTLLKRIGSHSEEDAQDRIAWLRGFEVNDPDYVKGSNDVVRSWLMGDPIHSRPVAVNYGAQPGFSEDLPDIKVFLGGNDGFMHAFQDSPTGTNATGAEVFAFIPDELLNLSGVLMGNSPAYSHPYGVDGAPAAGTIDLDNDGTIEAGEGDKALLFFGLRRGGRSMYALDISNPDFENTPPSLAWRIKKPVTVSGTGAVLGGNTSTLVTQEDLVPNQLKGGRLIIASGVHAGAEPFYHIIENGVNSITVAYDEDPGTGDAVPEFIAADNNVSYKAVVYGSNDFPELGMTFSSPRLGRVRFGSESTPVVFFAGGYDPDKDNMGNGDDDEGIAIYIVNALTGELIWKVAGGSGVTSDTVFMHPDMVDSIPAEIETLDSNSNGVVDRVYVGDTGGAVWRLDLPEGEGAGWRRNNWFASKLAELGNDSTPNDRRFFHGVDVVQTKDSCAANCGTYDGVVIASGNRASPKDTSTQNYLFVIKDRLTTSGDDNARVRTPFTVSDLEDITNICITGDEPTCQSADLSNGWKLALEQTGEKSLATPLVSSGTIFFTSYLPEGQAGSAQCAPSEGEGLIYAVRLSNGAIDADVMGVDLDTSTKANRYTQAGAGIPPGATKLGDGSVLLPGKGINDRQIIDQESESFWKIFWRELGFDKY